MIIILSMLPTGNTQPLDELSVVQYSPELGLVNDTDHFLWQVSSFYEPFSSNPFPISNVKKCFVRKM